MGPPLQPLKKRRRPLLSRVMPLVGLLFAKIISEMALEIFCDQIDRRYHPPPAPPRKCIELEVELTQTQMAQKPMSGANVHARAFKPDAQMPHGRSARAEQ